MAYIQLRRQKVLQVLALITVLSVSACSEQKKRNPSADAPVKCENNRDRVLILKTEQDDISITLNPNRPLAYTPTRIINKSKFVPNCSGPILARAAFVGAMGHPKLLPVKEDGRPFAVTRLELSLSSVIPDDSDEWPDDAFNYKKQLYKDARLEMDPNGKLYTAVSYFKPNGDPLVIYCSKGPSTKYHPARCEVGYKISSRVTLRYKFNRHDYSLEEYLELDNAVRKFLIEEVIVDLSDLQ